MENCIFCKIVKGEIPSNKVYEDDNFLAFLSIDPESPGHTLVIPKEHYRWAWEVPNIGEYFEVARKIAKAQQKAFDTEWILSKIEGQEIHHAHIWVFPGIKEGDTASSKLRSVDKKDFAKNAKKIIENL